MTYEQALDFIHGTERFGSKPGLSRINALLNQLGNPEKNIKFIHVAGTNGKGSTSAMIASILQHHGLKTGLFVSPFVDDFCERIQINRTWIDHQSLAALTKKVIEAIDKILENGGMHPTEFEIVTAIGFLYFKTCDIVVLEVGLGGRFDATNVIPPPLVAVITSLSIDHTAYLGETISEIAFEKCGIIKQGCCVVTAFGQPPEALRIIEKSSENLIVPELPEVLKSDLTGNTFKYKNRIYQMPLIGKHQIQNAATVIEVIHGLRNVSEIVIDDDVVLKGLKLSKWNGRLEIVSTKPLCIVDAAHNIDSIRVLCDSIDTLFAKKRLISIMGMCIDKDLDSCVPMIASRSECFIAVKANVARAADAEVLKNIAISSCEKVMCFTDLSCAVKHAFSMSDDNTVILACGSLYMIGDAKKFMLEFQT